MTLRRNLGLARLRQRRSLSNQGSALFLKQFPHGIAQRLTARAALVYFHCNGGQYRDTALATAA